MFLILNSNISPDVSSLTHVSSAHYFAYYTSPRVYHASAPGQLPLSIGPIFGIRSPRFNSKWGEDPPLPAKSGWCLRPHPAMHLYSFVTCQRLWIAPRWMMMMMPSLRTELFLRAPYSQQRMGCLPRTKLPRIASHTLRSRSFQYCSHRQRHYRRYREDRIRLSIM